MALYEHVFISRQDLSNQQAEGLIEHFGQILTDNGGSLKGTEYWGLRTLAYKIKRNRKAHFVMLDIEAPAGAVAELERQTAINEDVIRYMTVRVDEHESGPSVMMRKNDRDRDRGDRDRPRRRDREEM